MAHLRFDFFFNEQRQEVHVNWNFLFILGFEKKGKAQRRGDLKGHIFSKGPGVIMIFFSFFKLEFLGFWLYDYKF